MHSTADSRSFTAYRAPRVQQSVVATGGARGELAALDQRDPDAAQRQVVGERAAGAAAADDQDVWRIAGCPRCDRVIDASIAPRRSASGPTCSCLLCLLPLGEAPPLVLRPPRSPDLRRSRRALAVLGVLLLLLTFGERPSCDARRAPSLLALGEVAVLARPPCCSFSVGVARGTVATSVPRSVTPPSRTSRVTAFFQSAYSFVALGGVHLRLPLLVLAPVGAEVVDVLPEADGEAGGVRRTERRGLRHLRPDHRHAAGRPPGTASAGRCRPCRRRP